MTTETKSSPGVARCHRRVEHLFALVGYRGNFSVSFDAVKVAHALIDMTPGMAKAYHIVLNGGNGGLLFEFERQGWDYAIEIAHTGMIEVSGVNAESLVDMGLLNISLPVLVAWLESRAP